MRFRTRGDVEDLGASFAAFFSPVAFVALRAPLVALPFEWGLLLVAWLA